MLKLKLKSWTFEIKEEKFLKVKHFLVGFLKQIFLFPAVLVTNCLTLCISLSNSNRAIAKNDPFMNREKFVAMSSNELISIQSLCLEICANNWNRQLLAFPWRKSFFLLFFALATVTSDDSCICILVWLDFSAQVHSQNTKKRLGLIRWVMLVNGTNRKWKHNREPSNVPLRVSFQLWFQRKRENSRQKTVQGQNRRDSWKIVATTKT